MCGRRPGAVVTFRLCLGRRRAQSVDWTPLWYVWCVKKSTLRKQADPKKARKSHAYPTQGTRTGTSMCRGKSIGTSTSTGFQHPIWMVGNVFFRGEMNEYSLVEDLERKRFAAQIDSQILQRFIERPKFLKFPMTETGELDVAVRIVRNPATHHHSPLNSLQQPLTARWLLYYRYRTRTIGAQSKR
jgi:hypothetical protein